MEQKQILAWLDENGGLHVNEKLVREWYILTFPPENREYMSKLENAEWPEFDAIAVAIKCGDFESDD